MKDYRSVRHLYNVAVYQIDPDMIWSNAPDGAVHPTEEEIMSKSNEELDQLCDSLKKTHYIRRVKIKNPWELLWERPEILRKFPKKPVGCELHLHQCDDPGERCHCGQCSYLVLDYAGEPIEKPKPKKKKAAK